MLEARLIGFSAKFGVETGVNKVSPGYMGLIEDSTSCEEAVFTAVDSFADMTIDISIGATVSQTQTIELSTAWGKCAYDIKFTPEETWLTGVTLGDDQIRIDVLSSDPGLIDIIKTIQIDVIPEYKDSNGPADLT